MVYYVGSIPCVSYDIYHYGVKGMKWGKNIFGDRGLIDRYVTGRSYKRVEQHDRDTARNLHNMAYGAGQNSSALYRNALSAQIGANEAKRAYDQTVFGRVANAYSSAAKAVGNGSRNIVKFSKDVMRVAGDTVKKGVLAVAKFGGTALETIKRIGGNVIYGAKAWLASIFNRQWGANNGDESGESRYGGSSGGSGGRGSTSSLAENVADQSLGSSLSGLGSSGKVRANSPERRTANGGFRVQNVPSGGSGGNISDLIWRKGSFAGRS